MHDYQSFDDIEIALKKLKLKQQIDIEEFKQTGYAIKDKFTFNNNSLLSSIGLKIIKNFSLILLVKKFFKKFK